MCFFLFLCNHRLYLMFYEMRNLTAEVTELIEHWTINQKIGRHQVCQIMTLLISFFQMDFSYAQILFPDSFKNHGVLNKYPWVRLKQLKSNYEFGKVKIWQTHYPGRDKVFKSRNCLALLERIISIYDHPHLFLNGYSHNFV